MFSLFNQMADMPFEHDYKCFPCSFMPGNSVREDVNTGGKIIMPPSALDAVTRLNIPYPLLFQLYNPVSKRMTHCGVLEFVAEEGRIYIPYWMFRNLCLQEGQRVTVKSGNLPKGTFVKFQPQAPEFIEIHNPKAVLERVLRKFACLTKGDTISINYNNHDYEMCVLECLPADAISIIECDLNVDFAPPVGYKEPQTQRPEDVEEVAPTVVESEAFTAFGGAGRSLGKKKKARNGVSESTDAPPTNVIVAGPDLDFKIGKIVFVRAIPVHGAGAGGEENFEAFTGSGHTIKQKRKGK